jgi:carbonic anhydrase/acetyltransferase-like protein (isoleucine patch superfamily)
MRDPDMTMSRVNALVIDRFGRVHAGELVNENIVAVTNIQDGCVLHADPGYPLVVGNGVSIGHRVILHGCRVGDDVIVGMGAIVMNGATIGGGSLVGAGTLIPENTTIPSGVLVLGSPGKVRRELTQDEIESIRANAETYVLGRPTQTTPGTSR